MEIVPSKSIDLTSYILSLADLTQIKNFYISFTIETLQEALRENYGSDEDLRENWRFYDSLCNYKYLDKRVKKVIEGPYYSEVEEYRWIYE